MFYVYILYSIFSGKYYIGSCDNIETRLSDHNSKRVRSTKFFVPWKIVYKEVFKSRGEAVIRERQLKSWKSRKAIEGLMKKHF
jgi:putative endonuclease